MKAALFLLAVVAACAALASAAAQPHPPVSVQKQPAVVEVRHFDPQHPPKGMPPLKDNEAAVTVSNFTCRAQISIVVLSQDTRNGQCNTTLRVTTAEIAMELEVILWLPENPQEKLVAHEQGHGKISDLFYADAEKVARKLAEGLIGQTIQGSAANCQAATNNAMQEAMGKVTAQYLEQMSGHSSRVQDEYDKITEHGKNDTAEDQAIEQAMKTK